MIQAINEMSVVEVIGAEDAKVYCNAEYMGRSMYTNAELRILGTARRKQASDRAVVVPAVMVRRYDLYDDVAFTL